MRNYIPKKNNLYKLPHNIYMQMLYLLKDYLRIKKELLSEPDKSSALTAISDAVTEISVIIAHEYEKRTLTYGTLDSYRAFFDYSYYSYMFARKNSDGGASKSAWSLYKSKFAYLLAQKLKLV